MRELVAATLILLGGCQSADEAPAPVPALELTGRVVDAAHILEANFEAELTSELARLETDTGVQLVVVTTPDLQGQEIGQYSQDLGNSWGIGSADRDDGLLLVVAPNERKVRIAVGYGLETTVRDEEAGEIIERSILPEFREGNYATGIMQGVELLILEVSPVEVKEAA